MEYCIKLDPLQYYIFHVKLPEMCKADHSLTLHKHVRSRSSHNGHTVQQCQSLQHVRKPLSQTPLIQIKSCFNPQLGEFTGVV